MSPTVKPSRYNAVVRSGPDEILLYNAFTGALVEVNGQTLEAFERLGAGGAPRDDDERGLLDAMLSQRFLVDSALDELGEVKLRFWGAKYEQAGMSVSVMPTHVCNFKCVYCFEEESAEAMSEAVQESVLRFVEQNIPGRKLFHIDWYGGEPLLQLPRIVAMSSRIRALCEKHGVYYNGSATTNGYLLTPENAARLAEVGILHFQVTLDGVPDVHDKMRVLRSGKGTFDTIVENLRALPEGTDLAIRINVSPATLDAVPRLFDLLIERGLGGATYHVKPILPSEANPCRELHLGVEAFAKRVLPIYEYGLERGIRFDFLARLFRPGFVFCIVDNAAKYIVTAKGLLYKCSDSFDPSDAVASLDADGGLQPNPAANVRWFGKDPFEHAECRECPILPLCGGGCAMKRLKEVETPCPEYRFALPELLQLAHRFQHLLVQDPSA